MKTWDLRELGNNQKITGWGSRLVTILRSKSQFLEIAVKTSAKADIKFYLVFSNSAWFSYFFAKCFVSDRRFNVSREVDLEYVIVFKSLLCSLGDALVHGTKISSPLSLNGKDGYEKTNDVLMTLLVSALLYQFKCNAQWRLQALRTRCHYAWIVNSGRI